MWSLSRASCRALRELCKEPPAELHAKLLTKPLVELHAKLQ